MVRVEMVPVVIVVMVLQEVVSLLVRHPCLLSQMRCCPMVTMPCLLDMGKSSDLVWSEKANTMGGGGSIHSGGSVMHWGREVIMNYVLSLVTSQRSKYDDCPPPYDQRMGVAS